MGNLKLAVRTLTKTPFITAVAVLSLALGIGANAGIFSLFDQILLTSLPVDEPERLVNLSAPGPKPGSQSCNQAGDCDEVFSYPMYRDLEASGTAFAGIAAHRTFGANLAQDGQTISGEGTLVSGSYFSVLGVQPSLGRLIGPDDDRNIGEHFVAVLSHRYFENQLGADRSVLNRTIVVNGQPMTIIGVAERGFDGTTMGSRPDVFVPITMRGLMSPGWEGFENRRSYWAYVFARLRPAATVDQAASEVNTVYRGILAEVEAPLQAGMSDQTMERFRAKEIVLSAGERGQSGLHREAKAPLMMLFSVTGIVLFIACANIANLLLARGANRGQEMAIRGSIGGSRSQLLTQLLTEAVMLAILGGVASLLVANWTLSFIATQLPPEAVETMSFELQPSVFLFSGILAIGTGVLFGLYPALHSTRPDLVTLLKDSTGQPSGARSAARFRTSLVTAQLALSTALLVAAGLFIRSLINVSRVDLGLETENTVTFSLSPELNGYEEEDTRALFQRTEEGLAALPGVTSVTAALVPVLAGSNWGTDVRVEGFESGPDIDSNSRFNAVGADYFRTLGMPLLAGREFTLTDTRDTEGVAIINEAFAAKFGLDSRQAVGKRMSQGGEDLDLEIVGVVQDAKYADVKQAVPPLFFRPYRQYPDVGSIYFYVHTANDSDAVFRAIPGVVGGFDPNLPVEELKTLEQQKAESVFLDRMISTLSAAFALLATLLAAVGLYGVLAYTVAQRTREIGLRMALGAAGANVRSMILRQVGRMTIVGGVVGVLTALALGRAARSLLYELEGPNPGVIGIVAILLAAVSLAAGYLPARRASRVDPMEALRYE